MGEPADNSAENFAQWVHDGWRIVDSGLITEDTFRLLLDKLAQDYRARVAVLEAEQKHGHVTICPKCGQEVNRG